MNYFMRLNDSFVEDNNFNMQFYPVERERQMQRERDQKLDREQQEVEDEIARITAEYNAQSKRLEAEDILSDYYQKFPFRKGEFTKGDFKKGNNQ